MKSEDIIEGAVYEGRSHRGAKPARRRVTWLRPDSVLVQPAWDRSAPTTTIPLQAFASWAVRRVEDV